MDYTTQLEEYIDLMDYSKSNSWFGFSERCVKYTPDLLGIAQESLFEFFGDCLYGSRLMFNFHYWSSRKKLISDYQLDQAGVDILDDLESLNWIEYNSENEKISGIEINSKNKENLSIAIKAIFMLGDHIGKVFIEIPSKDITVYPHEDTGFGVFTKKLECQSSEYFLKYLASINDFSAYIGKRNEKNKIQPWHS